MVLVRKFRACFIIFLLLVSSLSLFVISPVNVRADEENMWDLFDQGDELDPFTALLLHPYITAGMLLYDGNETLEINGDLIFDLYYTSTFFTQRNYRDDLRVTLYTLGINLLTQEPYLKEIENGNTTVTLKPEKFGDLVQHRSVTLENIKHNLTTGDTLIFAVEIIQSGKPIGDIIERRYERKLKSRLQKVGEFFNNSGDESLIQIGDGILQILELTEEFGITGEEIGSLVDSLISSSFVYNSKEYPSSVTLPTTNLDDNLTLYFRYALDYENEALALTDMTEKTPNGTATTWPPALVSLDPDEGLNIDNWLIWATINWLTYVTIGKPSEEEDENIITYYLTSEKKLVTGEPEGFSPSRITLRNPVKWDGISIERNKIIKNVTAELYLHYPRLITLRKINVNVTLFDGNISIASDEKKMDRTTLLDLLQRGPVTPTTFTFKELEDKEIWHGKDISLKVSVSEGPFFSLLRSTILLCGSEDYPSSLTFNFEETTNIEMTIVEGAEQKPVPVIPGGSTEFVLNITSKYADTVDIEITPEDEDDLNNWSITVQPESVDIAGNGSAIVHVFVNSTDDTINAEGHKIEMTFAAAGLTGYDSEEVTVKVSKDAVEYHIIVPRPSGKEIKHGESGTYTFIIKNNNTGVWPDSYEIEASSEHDWNVSCDKKEIMDVDIGEEFLVDVTVSVPWYTDIPSDVLKFTVISKESDGEFSYTVNVKTTVINPNIFESIYQFFESVAEDLGLDEALGAYAAAFLIFIVVFLILIFIIPAIYLIKKKYIEIVCLDRIKDITSDEEAKFDITLQNPSKKRTLTYELHTEMGSESENWDISLDKESVIVEPKQSSAVVLTVKPTDYVKSDDWIEVKVIAKVVERKKSAEISTAIMIKDGKPEIKITGVFHSPKVFKKDDRVETSFRLRNTGNVSVSNINVILYVNGKEKNKVEDITIPRAGYAEIDMPWIAVKGKNDINIIVK